MSYYDLTKIDLGACKIYYWDNVGWVPIGATIGGVSIDYEPTWFDLKIDQLGETVVKKLMQGEGASLNFGIAETGMDKLALAIPFGTVFTSGDDQAMGVGSNPGGDLLTKMVKLYVHPINMLGANNTDDETYIEHDFTIWKAGNADALNIPFDPNAPRVYKVKMSIFPDLDQDAGKYLFVIGDPTLTGDAVAPTVNTLGQYPAEGATGVAITVSPRMVLTEKIRELTGVQPNAKVDLLKVSDHSHVAHSVTFEQAIEGTALAGTTTTMDLKAGEIDSDDQFNGLYVEIYEGTGAAVGTLTAITDSTNANERITVAAWPAGTPDTTSKYRIHASRITIDPTASLSNSTAYMMVMAQAEDLAGNIQTNVFASAFTTAL